MKKNDKNKQKNREKLIKKKMEDFWTAIGWRTELWQDLSDRLLVNRLSNNILRRLKTHIAHVRASMRASTHENINQVPSCAVAREYQWMRFFTETITSYGHHYAQCSDIEVDSINCISKWPPSPRWSENRVKLLKLMILITYCDHYCYF